MQPDQQWQNMTCRKPHSAPCIHTPWGVELSDSSETNRRGTYPATRFPSNTISTREEQLLLRRKPEPVLPNTHSYHPSPNHSWTKMRNEYIGEDPVLLKPSKDSWGRSIDDDHSRGPVFRVTHDPPLQEVAKLRPDQNPSIVLSPAESHTLSIHSSNSSNAERANHICDTVRAVHDVCLQSSKTYLNTHLVNLQARGVGSSGYLTNSNAPSANNEGVVSSSRGDNTPMIPESTESLLTNISNICSMLWTNSQHNRLAVVNIERLAVDNMGRLLMWAEAVTLGDYDEWQNSDETALGRVMEAGKNLCGWLSVPDGIQAMRRLERDVTKTTEEEENGALRVPPNGCQGHGTLRLGP
ncbi:hypothetical protein GGS26DRAFT_578246 [Hypomontagnella submonticulosa]|nr:hypothetical protein GGS26DRAFT_578246 [Hypomontagnella submonticulosa]